MGCIFLTSLKPYSDWNCGFERAQSSHPDKLVLVVKTWLSSAPHEPHARSRNIQIMGCIFLTSLKSYSDLICGFERVQSYHPDKLVLVVEIVRLTGHVNSWVPPNQLDCQASLMSRTPARIIGTHLKDLGLCLDSGWGFCVSFSKSGDRKKWVHYV